MGHLLTPLHLGELHPYETVLMAVLAFGPFVVLAIVMLMVRRRDSTADHEHDGSRE